MVAISPSGSSRATASKMRSEPARMVGPRHQGLAAGGRHCLADFGLIVGDHHHRTAFGLHRAAPDMHDHGLAGDLGQGLVRQPCRL